MAFHCVNCTCSPGQEVESLAGCFVDMYQSAPLNWKRTLETSYCKDNETDTSLGSQFGMMYAHLTASRGAERLTSYAEDSHAKISHQQEKARVYPVADPVYGGRCQESLAKYDPLSHSLKTPQGLFPEDSTLCLQTLPAWGMMRSGECWEVMMSGLVTIGNACGYWPTPTCMVSSSNWETTWQERNSLGLATAVYLATPQARDWKEKTLSVKIGALHWKKEKTKTLPRQLSAICPELHGKTLSPDWIEWLMGWPIGWTDQKPLVTAKTHEWSDSLGSPC